MHSSHVHLYSPRPMHVKIYQKRCGMMYVVLQVATFASFGELSQMLCTWKVQVGRSNCMRHGKMAGFSPRARTCCTRRAWQRRAACTVPGSTAKNQRGKYLGWTMKTARKPCQAAGQGALGHKKMILQQDAPPQHLEGLSLAPLEIFFSKEISIFLAAQGSLVGVIDLSEVPNGPTDASFPAFSHRPSPWQARRGSEDFFELFFISGLTQTSKLLFFSREKKSKKSEKNRSNFPSDFAMAEVFFLILTAKNSQASSPVVLCPSEFSSFRL
jgi:hypothetical protein